MSIELFNVVYRPGLDESPISLLCQAVDVGGEKFLWVDGVSPEDPVMISVTAVKNIELVGSFKEFLTSRMDLAQAVISASLGQHSPTILARATLYMTSDKSMSAEVALEVAESQGLDILDADDACSDRFGVEMKSFSPALTC